MKKLVDVVKENVITIIEKMESNADANSFACELIRDEEIENFIENHADAIEDGVHDLVRIGVISAVAINIDFIEDVLYTAKHIETIEVDAVISETAMSFRNCHYPDELHKHFASIIIIYIALQKIRYYRGSMNTIVCL